METNENLKKIEVFHFEILKKWMPYILDSSKEFSLDPKTVVSILYTERVFRTIGDILAIMKSSKDELVKVVLKCPYLGRKVVEKLDFSIGFTYIKMGTAKKAVEYAGGSWGTWDGYWLSEKSSIRMMSLYLRCLTDFWSTHCDVSRRPEILGTLFNITVPWVKPKPRANPESGGSVVATVIDGEYIEGLNFGNRVLKSYYSNKMEEFFNGFSCNTNSL